jgi:hypothetical protein
MQLIEWLLVTRRWPAHFFLDRQRFELNRPVSLNSTSRRGTEQEEVHGTGTGEMYPDRWIKDV